MGRYGVNVAPNAGIKSIQRGQYGDASGDHANGSTAQQNIDRTIEPVDVNKTFMVVNEAMNYPVTTEGGGVTDNRVYPAPQAKVTLQDENTIRIAYRVSSFGQSEKQWVGYQVVEMM